MSAPASFTISLARHTVARVILRSAWEATAGWPLVQRARLLAVATWLAVSFLATGREEPISARAVFREHGWVALFLVPWGVFAVAPPFSSGAAYTFGALVGAMGVGWGVTKRPPPARFWLGAAGILAAGFLVGCTTLGPAKAAANALDDALVEVAPEIEAKCIEPFAPARVTATDIEERMAQADEIRRRRELSGCRPILRTYDDARNAQLLAHATVGAIEVGACVGVSRSAEQCNVAAAMAAAWKARTAVLGLSDRLRGVR